MIKIDKLDEKILYHLDHGGRESYSNLARKLRYGRDIIEYRIKRLEKLGVIQGYRALIDPYAFDLTLYKAYLKLSVGKSELSKIIKLLKKEEKVFWIAECSGSIDLIFSIAAKSPYEYYQTQTKIFNQIKTHIITWNIFTVVNFKMFRLKYLHKVGTHYFDFGQPKKRKAISDFDKKLINLISSSARLPVTTYAEILNVSIDKVNRHLSMLEKEKYILGYKAIIDLKKLRINHFKAQIFVNEFNPKEEERLLNYCMEHKNVTECITQIGQCRLEIEIQAENYEAYNEIISKIRSEFRTLIRNVETIILRNDSFNWKFIN